MVWLARFIVALIGLASLTAGLTAWFAPAEITAALGLQGVNAVGENSMRGDVGAVFLFPAVACFVALTRRQSWAYAAAMMFSIVALGRIAGALQLGWSEEIAFMIGAEIVLAVLLIWAGRTLVRG